MKLSEIDKEILSDEDIDKIVYDNTGDNGQNSYYGLVFGNSMLLNERVEAAVLAYKNKRIKKIIFSGGINGISNSSNDLIPEAVKMRNLAIELGVNKDDILCEDKANNSFENVEYSFNLIGDKIDKIAIITSEFHLKRCMAIMKKYYKEDIEYILVPAKDGFTDRENWFLSEKVFNSGRSLVEFEADLLIKYAKENKLYDLEIK